MVVIVLYDVSSVLPAPLPLMRINGGKWIVVRRGDEGIAPYKVLPYVFVGADALIGPCDRRRNLFSAPASGSGAGAETIQ